MESRLLKYLLIFIRERMEKERISQVELAKRMGISKQSVSQLLTGEHSPRLSTLEALSNAFNVPLFILLMSPEERLKWEAVGMSAKDQVLSALETLDGVQLSILADTVKALKESSQKGILYPEKKKSG